QGLQVREIETSKPTGNQVLVKIDGSPCNPSDIAFMRGMYNIKKSLPKVAGFEGTGIVVEAGEDPDAKQLIGKRVSTFSQQDENGTWAEYFLTTPTNCLLLKEEMPAEQAACFFVNPFTAYGLFDNSLKRGDKAIVQNAAAGVVGTFIRKLAEKDGIPTLNIVRRPVHVEQLKSEGEKYVLNSRDKEFENHPPYPLEDA
ncbi:alcohol dehydrogenase catalytic domain-containing protein, partial [Bacteroidota bacterium]